MFRCNDQRLIKILVEKANKIKKPASPITVINIEIVVIVYVICILISGQYLRTNTEVSLTKISTTT